MLIQTFVALAAENEDLLRFLQDMADGLTNENEADICDAIVSLACEDPQCPLTGDDLWKALVKRSPESADEPNFLGLLSETQDRIGFLKGLRAQSADRPPMTPQSPARVLAG